MERKDFWTYEVRRLEKGSKVSLGFGLAVNPDVTVYEYKSQELILETDTMVRTLVYDYQKHRAVSYNLTSDYEEEIRDLVKGVEDIDDTLLDSLLDTLAEAHTETIKNFLEVNGLKTDIDGKEIIDVVLKDLSSR